jgi:predicted dehydrogenase
MTKFRIGIVGAGLIAREHCLSLSRLPQVEKLLFFDADSSRAAKLASEFNGTSTPSLRELTQQSDIVWICTPPFARREALEVACEMQRPIFCEKPLAIARNELLWMQRLISDANVPFFMGQSNRYGAYFQKMHELAQGGEVGEITSIWSARQGYLDIASTPPWRMDDSKSGGTVVELGIHEIDFARWVGGEWHSVYARGSSQTLVPGQFQDTVAAIGALQSGATMRLDLSWANPRYLWQRGVEGTEGSLFFDDSRIWQIELHRPQHEPEIFQVGDWQDKTTGENLSLRKQAKAVLQALADGRTPPVSLQDGAAAAEIALAIRYSIQSGTVVNCAASQENA